MAVAATIFLITFNGIVFGGVLNAIHRDLGAFQHGHIEILNEKEGVIDEVDWQIILKISANPVVEAAAPRVAAYSSINHTTAHHVYSVYGVRTLGVNPILESRTSKIFDSVIIGEANLSKGSAFIGKDLAEDLKIERSGEIIRVKVANVWGDYTVKQFRISGIVSSSAVGGLNNILIIHIDTLREMLGWQHKYSTSIIVKLKDPGKASEVKTQLEKIFPDYEVKTVEEAGKILIKAVREGVAFINLVGYAGMIASALAIITVLTMMVSGKTRDIGILRALGVSRKSIVAIFILDGALIGVIGAAIGGLISSMVGLWLENYPVAFFGGIVLDVKFRFTDLLIPMIVGFIISVLASIYPAWKASRYEPAEAMRYF
jgi:lipoprotein-releasing system permease protein